MAKQKLNIENIGEQLESLKNENIKEKVSDLSNSKNGRTTISIFNSDKDDFLSIYTTIMSETKDFSLAQIDVMNIAIQDLKAKTIKKYGSLLEPKKIRTKRN